MVELMAISLSGFLLVWSIYTEQRIRKLEEAGERAFRAIQVLAERQMMIEEELKELRGGR